MRYSMLLSALCALGAVAEKSYVTEWTTATVTDWTVVTITTTVTIKPTASTSTSTTAAVEPTTTRESQVKVHDPIPEVASIETSTTTAAAATVATTVAATVAASTETASTSTWESTYSSSWTSVITEAATTSTASTTATTTTSSATTSSATTSSATTSSATTSSATATATATAANTYQSNVIYSHNVHRSNHSATSLTWSDDLEASAQVLAARCVYEHDTSINGGGYGQNIGYGVSADDVAVMISNLMYNDEMEYFASLYGEANPDMTDFEKWGHFSQIVWKGTTKVGCATVTCNSLGNVDSSMALPFTVCNYGPPGNYDGEYADNVGRPLGDAPYIAS
ncbi:hypothetical protein P175DRAFT_0529806 [Aspergillus ochraceoroseus IBT 24754]|uniref:SCP domain-containing protein n=2 Tax=Aspergillus ochraceoroseus TaxID=138278 RepID=A0A2T5M2H2_9EURO|nr:uncharacterized protein P175DRAFT_0529806 [Aspergillus ochraceoroseus IBT 24754]KKK14627.1 hypothetical protein AOCH_005015 [Aspergillus ochraceoroseus]PTU22727.1 hypothetical protein P175DRAFT_0529806 [Aspergillus ochraceoroseus IBT 24754]